jgi:hypothetical protein
MTKEGPTLSTRLLLALMAVGLTVGYVGIINPARDAISEVTSVLEANSTTRDTLISELEDER